MTQFALFQPETIDRAQAAAQLRTARCAQPEQSIEAAEWALAAMPERLHATRLAIDVFLRENNLDAAEALITLALRQRPEHPSLRLRQARCLHQRGSNRIAERKVARLLRDRPHHRGTLRLAALIASDLGQFEKALAHIDQAIELWPGDFSLAHLRIEILLAAGKPHEAAEALGRAPNPSALQRAQVLRAQHRLIEAAELLEVTVSSNPGSVDACQAQILLLDVLEDIGDADPIRRTIQTNGRDNPEVILKGAMALLALGDFEAAHELATHIGDCRDHRRSAMHITLAAQTMDGPVESAQAILDTLSSSPRGIDAGLMSDCWLRSLRGRVVSDQANARQAAVDPSISALRPLLEQAAAALLSRAAHAANPAESLAIDRHLATCLDALGRPPKQVRVQITSQSHLSRQAA